MPDQTAALAIASLRPELLQMEALLGCRCDEEPAAPGCGANHPAGHRPGASPQPTGGDVTIGGHTDRRDRG